MAEVKIDKEFKKNDRLSKEKKSRKDEYILRLKVFHKKLGRIPSQTEFHKAGLGEPNTIKKFFGGMDKFVEAANLPKDKEFSYDIDIDMDRLRKIMINYNVDPIIKQGQPGHCSVAKLMFVNIIADSYPEIRINSAPPGNVKNKPDKNKLRVKKFLDCNQQTLIYHLSEGRIKTLIDYKNYENMYKMIKAGYNKDSNYFELVKQRDIRDKAQSRMDELTKNILKNAGTIN